MSCEITALDMRNKTEIVTSASSRGNGIKYTCQPISNQSFPGKAVVHSRVTSEPEVGSEAALNIQSAVGNSQSATKICATGTSNEEGRNSHLKESPHPSLPTNGTNIISSPYKIGQGVRCKKRGLPPKKTKSSLLKHKKSTLYSGFDSKIISEQDTITNYEFDRGSINDCAQLSGAKQTCFNSVVLACEKLGSEVLANNCDNYTVEKTSSDQHTCRNTHNLSAVSSRKVTDAMPTTNASKLSQENLKHYNYRSNRNSYSLYSKLNIAVPKRQRQPSDNVKSSSLSPPLSTIKQKVEKTVYKKSARKSIVEQREQETLEMPHSAHRSLKQINHAEDRIKNSNNATVSSVSDKVKKKTILRTNEFISYSEKSVSQGNDSDAFLTSVKPSVHNKFSNEDVNNGVLSFDNPFTLVRPTSFAKFLRSESPILIKPKAKKPKLHVMMRQTKRKKKRKLQNNKDTNIVAVKPSKSDVSIPMTPKNDQRISEVLFAKFQRKAAVLNSSLTEEKLPLSTSFVQPSKILTLSRLNIFNSGANMDGPHLSGSSTDVEQSDWSDKKRKKRYRLLYRKSKHKNIVDPVFATDLDSLVSGLNGISICENPADNYVRVRPGEMPLPSIFRVIKIDMNRKVKDRSLIPEIYGQDKTKVLKSRKDTFSPPEVSSTVKLACKGGRKKSCSDQTIDQKEHLFLGDSSDQCLPPKKRHRLMNIEASMSAVPRDSSADETAKKLKPLSWSQKEVPSRRASGTDETKPVPGRLAQLCFGQELTIDTSSFAPGELSTCTPSLSLSPSRLSTRSSTLPSLSSPSPSGSYIFNSRHHPQNNCALVCAAHTPSSSLNDRLSCTECCLVEQSPSSVRSTLRSLSIQASDSSCSSERPVSSSEPSPVPKETAQLGRSTRKRRKSSNRSVSGADRSPPLLEKTISLVPDSYNNNSIYPEPPEIISYPFRRYVSPRWHSSDRVGLESVDSPTSPSSPQKMCSYISPQKCSDISPSSILIKPSPTPVTCDRKLCSKRSISPQTSSKLVIWPSYSEYEPLPLEHCSNRKFVAEIQAATASDSSDEDRSDSDQPDQPSATFTSTMLNQPPRKRFQKIGLFSDFYKDEEPSKNSENMMRHQDKLAYVREEHKFGLMPQPLHIGQFYMGQVQDFQLPYDIWWQRIHQQLPKKSERIVKCHTNGAIHVNSHIKMNGHDLDGPHTNCTQQLSSGASCENEYPNRNLNDSDSMDLFALQDFKPEEEYTSNWSFDSLSQESRQECYCCNSDSRSVIGVKVQHSSGSCKLAERIVGDCKDKRKDKLLNKKVKDKPSSCVAVQPPAKPMTFKERCYARKHRTFLVRNVDRICNQRSPNEDFRTAAKKEISALDSNRMNSLSSDPVQAHINGRSVKTRLAAYAKDNPEIARRHHLAQTFERILTELMLLKDEDGYNLVGPLMSLPSTKKEPQYYEVVKDPIDLSIIKQRVKMGYYDHLSSFNADMMLLFNNVELYYGSKSDMGKLILKLRKILDIVKANMASQIDELLGPDMTRKVMDSSLEKVEKVSRKEHSKVEEDVIRCICGVTRDEGLMLQCEKCMIWQHCDCVHASGNEDHYLCDRCEPRYYDPEILLIPQPPDGQPNCTYYLTFVRDGVQYAVGDCVYVMRDCKRTANGTPLRSSNSPTTSVNPDMLDIFRLHQLWKNSKGIKFANGTPYLRPQETFHEPTRKFYHNELFRTPNFETIPMELVAGKCVVMDPGTYVKGRPKGVREQDVYICEYRVDKTAHLFYKIPKIWYLINTNKFCFDWFDTKLVIKRTYLPHKLPDEYKRKVDRYVAAVPSSRLETVKKKGKLDMKTVSTLAGLVKVDETVKNDFKLKAEVKVHVNKGIMHNKDNDDLRENNKMHTQAVNDRKKKEKKQRLDKILTKLLSNLPGKQKIDLSYLLDERKRIRKKVTK